MKTRKLALSAKEEKQKLRTWDSDDDPIEMLSPVYQGLTCQPPTLYVGGINSGNCTLGGFPEYAVAATNVKVCH